MNINRRMFFSTLLFAQSPKRSSIRVTVLETFGLGQEVLAVLVHHSEPAAREQFAQWLQMHPKHAIRARSGTGDEAPGTIFRVRMCFGRGLILLEKHIPVRERDVLSVFA